MNLQAKRSRQLEVTKLLQRVPFKVIDIYKGSGSLDVLQTTYKPSRRVKQVNQDATKDGNHMTDLASMWNAYLST